MPRAQLDESLKSSGTVDQFEALKLQTGEWARLLIVNDEDAWFEWVHAMRAPVLDDADMPVIIDKQRKDGSTYPDYSTRFVGQRICLGDPAIVEDKGMDPGSCPACAAAQRGVKGMSPERRFAVPVIRYKTKDNSRKGGSSVDLQSPPQAEILVWKLSQRMFNSLMDTKNEIRELLEIPADQKFPLRAADIVVYCEDGGFQRVIFKAPKRPAYRADKVVENLIRDLWGNEDNRPTDAQLKAACGRAGDREYMMVDVEATEHGWKCAERVGKDGTRRSDPDGDSPVSGGSGPSLAEDLDALLADHPADDDLFGGDALAAATASAGGNGNGSARTAVAAAPDDFDPLAENTPVPAAVSNGSGGSKSFDELLAD